MKLKVGITGQSGFIGSHLQVYLRANEEVILVTFQRRFFVLPQELDNFLQSCDVVVHLAGMNRGSNHDIYETNVQLAEKLVSSLERTGHKPHVIYSSSTHEDRDSPYGKSKRESRLILSKWAHKNNAKFTGLIIPNVYGPFCKPFYNSVVATFCHQLIYGLTPKVHDDHSIGLIYVNELVLKIYEIMKNGLNADEMPILATEEIMVSDLLSKLIHFKEKYLNKKIVPNLGDPFDLSLFNTFRSYIEPKYYPIQYDLKTDDRGYLFEVVKSLNQGQVFFSSTKPGIERGNHYHRRKVERFSIIKGKALVQMRRVGTDKIIEYTMDGNKPSFVDIPIIYTHNLVNTGEDELLMLFWTSELFNPDDPDTIYEKVTGRSQ